MLLLWIPLRQRPGLGTVSNVIVVGIALDATIAIVDAPDALGARIVFLVAGVLLNGVATGMYIGARFGPGPRDGLMTGLAARGMSLRAVRTGIELTVCSRAPRWAARWASGRSSTPSRSARSRTCSCRGSPCP